LYQKLSKSGDRFSSYSQKCQGGFFWDTVYMLYSIMLYVEDALSLCRFKCYITYD